MKVMNRMSDVMASFTVGDKVRVIGLTENDRTGEIIAKGDIPLSPIGRVVVGKEFEPELVISWWKVKLDGTGEVQTFPNDRLEKIG